LEKTEIIIHQAYYGEVNRAHGCIDSSLKADASMASFLTAFTDRPSAMPAGVQMSTYISGINYEDKFIFIRTLADNNASRGGMVFSHTLIVDIGDLAMINDLKRLFALFVISKPETLKGLEPLRLSTMENTGSSLETLLTKDSQEITAGLIANNLPVVFCGELSAFVDAIATIWNGLPASFRKSLTFSVAFSPANLDSGKKIIYVQPSLATAFRNRSMVGGKNQELVTDLTEAEKYILTQEKGNDFDSFIRTLQVDLNDWSILTPAVKAYHFYKKLRSDIKADEARQLIRLLAKISPSPASGADIKNEVLAYVSGLIKNGMDTNVKALRNLTLQEFQGGRNLLGSSINELLKGMFEGQLALDTELMLDLYRAVDPVSGEKWWSDAVTNTLTACSSTVDSSAMQALWVLLGHVNAPLNSILKHIPADAATSEKLSKYLPLELSPEAADKIVNLIKPRKWYLLHARLLQIAKPMKDAIIEQYQFERALPESSFKGTKFLMPRLSDTDLLDLCLESADDLFIDEYAARSIKTESLLHPLEVAENTWLRIWSASLEKTNDLLHGIKELAAKVNGLFSELLKGESIPVKILALLAESQYADLTENKQRMVLWKKLPNEVLPIFLNTTAQSFLKRMADGEELTTPEQELSAEIGQDQVMTQFLSKYRGQLSAVVNVYEGIPGLKDKFLADYISYYHVQINEFLSIRLGNIIAAKLFKLSARQIFEKAKHDQSYRPALSACGSLIDLGFWDKLRYGHLFGHSVQESDIYGMLQTVAVRLYEKGPEDNDIWKRAGGDNSKLSNNHSREDNWRDVVSMLHNGGGGKHVSVKALLRVMLEDHPNNADIKELLNYFKNK